MPVNSVLLRLNSVLGMIWGIVGEPVGRLPQKPPAPFHIPKLINGIPFRGRFWELEDMAKVFKDYTQGQTMLLPPSLDELIGDSHPVRLVHNIIDRLDLDLLLRKYKGGGASSYHPRMLLKVLVYGYQDNAYSSRKLEAHVR